MEWENLKANQSNYMQSSKVCLLFFSIRKYIVHPICWRRRKRGDLPQSHFLWRDEFKTWNVTDFCEPLVMANLIFFFQFPHTSTFRYATVMSSTHACFKSSDRIYSFGIEPIFISILYNLYKINFWTISMESKKILIKFCHFSKKFNFLLF